MQSLPHATNHTAFLPPPFSLLLPLSYGTGIGWGAALIRSSNLAQTGPLLEASQGQAGRLS